MRLTVSWLLRTQFHAPELKSFVMGAGIAAKNAERVATAPYSALVAGVLVGVCYSMQLQQPHLREPALDWSRILQALRLLKSHDV